MIRCDKGLLLEGAVVLNQPLRASLHEAGLTVLKKQRRVHAFSWYEGRHGRLRISQIIEALEKQRQKPFLYPATGSGMKEPPKETAH